MDIINGNKRIKDRFNLSKIMRIKEAKQIDTGYNGPALITLSYDDGHISNYNYAFPLHQQYNIKGNFNLHTSAINASSIRFTHEQIVECHNWGMEMSSHSHSHQRLTDLTDEQIHFECTESKRILSEILGGIEIPSLAVPFSFYDTRVKNIIAQHFESARIFSNQLNNIPPEDVHWLKSAIAVYNTTTFNQVKTVIDNAINSKKWCFIMLHGINPDVANLAQYEITPQLLEEIMIYINSFGNDILLPVTQHEGMEFISNL